MAFVFGWLAACAPMSPYEAINSPALREAVQNARTRGDHDTLARNFENLTREMRVKAEEQRKLLQHYQEKGYLYGRQAQDRQSHTWALMVRYEQAAEKSFPKAALHRQLAAGLGRNAHGSDATSGKNKNGATVRGTGDQDRVITDPAQTEIAK